MPILWYLRINFIDMMERGYMLDLDVYDASVDTLNFKRFCGIGSNMTVLMDLLMRFKLQNICPGKITTILTNYKGYDMYKEDLFVDKNYLQVWKDFSKDRVSAFYKKFHPNIFGFGNNKEELDLELFLTLFKTYFNLSKRVLREANFIKKKYNIKNNYNFVLFRKTDKVGEVNAVTRSYPELSDALNLSDNLKNTIVQTDDFKILDELKANSDVTILNELPITNNPNLGVHDMSIHLSDQEYKNKFGHEYKDHGCKLFAIMKIAAESKTFIGYPGNLSFHISLMRGNFNNVFFFKSKNTFY